ncbi:unnamed protein product [Phytophthora lilii]|uniref:Unnamed protein product n=1 Tax=Phytophthora lilii TaxID=2077276 RepID=A0A9W7CM76_9STRA|nr:unnamed protein product [Phytophthora lilii]
MPHLLNFFVNILLLGDPPSEVPNVDESIVEPVVTDSAVYKEEYNSDSEQLYNSDDSEKEVTLTATEVIKPTESQLRRWAYLIVSVNYLEDRDEIAEAEHLVLDQQQIDVLRKFVKAHTKKNTKGKDIESTLKRDSMVVIQHDIKDETDQFPLGIEVVLDAFNAKLKDTDGIYPSTKPNHLAYEHGYRYCFYKTIRHGVITIARLDKR